MASKSLGEIFQERIPGSSVDADEWADLLGNLRSRMNLGFPPGIDRAELAGFLEERLRESVGKFFVEIPRGTPLGSIEGAVSGYFAQFGFAMEYAQGNGADEFFRIYRRGTYAISAFATMSSRHGIQSVLLTLEEYEGLPIPLSC